MQMYLRLFMFTIFVLISFNVSCFAQSPIEQLTQEKTGGSSMHSRSFSGKKSKNNSIPLNEPAEDKTQSEADPETNSDPQQNEKGEMIPKNTKKTDPEEKIWKKYKKIAKSNNKNTASDDDSSTQTQAQTQMRKSKSFAAPEEKRRSFNDESSLEKDTEKKNTDEESDMNEDDSETLQAQDEEQKNGLSQALDGYLNDSENNRHMGQRSFGTPEDRNTKKKSSKNEESDDKKNEKQDPQYQE